MTQDKQLRSKESVSDSAKSDALPAGNPFAKEFQAARVTGGNSAIGWTVEGILEDGTVSETFTDVRPMPGNNILLFNEHSDRPVLQTDPDSRICGALIVGSVTWFTSS